MTREQKLKAVWQDTHRDYKGTIDGVKTILVCRKGATVACPLDTLTDKEIEDRLPKARSSPTWRV